MVKKVVAWMVIAIAITGCLLFYKFVNPTPLGLMPLVGCSVALFLGFLAAMGDRAKPGDPAHKVVK